MLTHWSYIFLALTHQFFHCLKSAVASTQMGKLVFPNLTNKASAISVGAFYEIVMILNVVYKNYFPQVCPSLWLWDQSDADSAVSMFCPYSGLDIWMNFHLLELRKLTFFNTDYIWFRRKLCPNPLAWLAVLLALCLWRVGYVKHYHCCFQFNIIFIFFYWIML